MNAMKQAQRFIATSPLHEDARTLAQLVLSLESHEPFPLEKLYELDLSRFDIAMEILKEWRLDRYYAGKSKLFDIALQLQDLQRGVEVESGPA
ncbi:MAG: hypothetical protein JWP29_740 [Rhodoferax sp.]|nr:hypothetical protein [Rhodoferax sp.]